jgi:hypothetical protein
VIIGMILLTGTIGIAVAVKGGPAKTETPVSSVGRLDPPSVPTTPAPDFDPEQVSAAPSAVEAPKPLVATLDRYRAWYREWWEVATQPPDPTDPLRSLKLQYEGFKRFPEAREQIFADIETFLAFLRDPKNEELLESLVLNLLGKMEQKGSGGAFNFAQKYGDFPSELMEGFFELLKTPGAAQRGILNFLGNVHDVPVKYEEIYEQLMHSSDSRVQYQALRCLSRGRPLDLPVLEKILARYETATDPMIRQIAISAISSSPRPETLNWALDQLESGRDPQSTHRLASAAASIAGKLTLDAVVTDRLVLILTAAIDKLTSEHEQNWTLWSSLYLPPEDSVRVLRAALPTASTPKLKSAIESTIAKAAAGSSTANDLQNHFWQLMK